VSHSLRVACRTCFLNRGIEAELCCLLVEGVLKFDGRLRAGLEMREEDVRVGGQLFESLAVLGVGGCGVEVREVVVELGEGGLNLTVQQRRAGDRGIQSSKCGGGTCTDGQCGKRCDVCCW
jgi:hypothetical protein